MNKFGVVSRRRIKFVAVQVNWKAKFIQFGLSRVQFKEA